MIKQNYSIEIDDASNGKIALEKFEKGLKKPCGCINRTYRLILMDIAMPIMDGIESSKKILRQIKDLKTSENLTNIVAVTSFDTKENVQKCMKAGI